MAQFVQPVGQAGDYLANLRAAAKSTGSGGGTGETFLKIDDRSGEMTYGQERVPLDGRHRFAVGLHGFRHGYIDMQGGQAVERNVVPMMSQPTRPMPPDGKFGTYESGGPRNVTEIELASIDEPGFRLVFTAWGDSSANRIRNLLELAVAHADGPDAASGFIHPVVVPKASKYRSNKYNRDVWHFDFELIDWLHADGETLLSVGARKAVEGNGRTGAKTGTDDPPFDEEDLDILE